MSCASSRIAASAVLTCAALAGVATPAPADDGATSRPVHAEYERTSVANFDELLDGDHYGDNAHVIKVPVSVVSSYGSSPTLSFFGSGPELSGTFGG